MVQSRHVQISINNCTVSLFVHHAAVAMPTDLTGIPDEAVIGIALFLSAHEVATIFEHLCKSTLTALAHAWDDLLQRDFGPMSVGACSLGTPGSAKDRYRQLECAVIQFRSPFLDSQISFVRGSDQVAYFRAAINLDSLERLPYGLGVYIEVVVQDAIDSLSLSLVDFDGKGSSSLTFSPDVGAVIAETKSNSEPLWISGKFAHCLKPQPRFGRGNVSMMGVFVSKNCEIEFLRQLQPGFPVHSTGVVGDCSWAHGGLITPCIAFRDQGEYSVLIRSMRVSARPDCSSSLQCVPRDWKSLFWSGDQTSEEDSN